MINFENRLKSLKQRRQGSREMAIYDSLGRNTVTANKAILLGEDVRQRERYEDLNEPVGVKYAIGAMAPVSEESTRISVEEGNRVADTLISILGNRSINSTKRMQGSVALDIHIEGHSDVDMLIICTDTVLMETPKLDGLPCIASDNRPMKDIVAELRTNSEEILSSRYHGATVDCSNSKSIALTGGSLKRKVDIVPSCWYYNHEYQRSNDEKDAGVEIYNKKEHSLISNFPFKHIARVNERDSNYGGNLKKVIRLMKNVVADMPDYKKTKAKVLSSYDLAGIAYHMDERLNVPSYMSLSLVEQTRDYLVSLKTAHVYRNILDVPDGTRKIFDNDKKLEALDILASEMSELAMSIFKELRPHQYAYDGKVIREKIIY